MIGVDTNVLVRYFTEDDEAQAEVAAQLFERQSRRGEPIRIGLVVLAELAWVLQSRYGATRAEIAESVDDLLTDPIVSIQDEPAVSVATNHYATTGGDFADLLIAAVNASQGCARTLTFDRRAATLDGMALLST
jgi:predicted nucleic-acid-binding protein